ncbi:uncharacterized protein LOC136026827 isoform X2 [Artemia franciscana]|uniref:Uncharacterized protein n=1 Tax=Artemia franciscana TaxID=6661 RepID=A0AA88IET5_ARTSF|nr:hypothetical protein QYM36_007768 [Artemia franciscana]
MSTNLRKPHLLLILALSLFTSTLNASEVKKEEKGSIFSPLFRQLDASSASSASSATATSAALAAASILVMVAMILQIILLGIQGGKIKKLYKGGYIENSNYNDGYSYDSQYAARGNDEIDWSAMNIVEYIAMLEEVWRKFDVQDLECQKRLICELHQDEETFGGIATNIVSMFNYLHYLSLIKLPGGVQDVFAEYMNAAEQGRSKTNNCSKVFNACTFSMKETYRKYFPKGNSLEE